MAQPITWQNVNGPNYTGISSTLQAAQNSFSNAFSGVQDILKERAALEATNAAAVKNNNTQAYLDQVAALGQTPEQLQGAIQSGELGRLRAGYGNNIDKAATRNAAESLLGDRYKQAMAATEFGNTMLNEKTAPIMDQFRQAAIRGDEAGKEAARTAYSAAGGKHGADLEQFAQTTSRDNLKWNETTKQWGRDEQEFKAKIKHMENQDANAAAQTAIASRNAAVNESELKLRTEDMGFKREDRAEDRIAKVSASLGALGNRNAASNEGTETVFKAITQNIKDPKSQGLAREAFSVMLKSIPNLTTSAALSGVLGTPDINWHTWDSTKVNKSVALARQALQASAPVKGKEADSPEAIPRAQEAVYLEQLNRARKDLEELRGRGKTSVKNPFN